MARYSLTRSAFRRLPARITRAQGKTKEGREGGNCRWEFPVGYQLAVGCTSPYGYSAGVGGFCRKSCTRLSVLSSVGRHRIKQQRNRADLHAGEDVRNEAAHPAAFTTISNCHECAESECSTRNQHAPRLANLNSCEYKISFSWEYDTTASFGAIRKCRLTALGR